MDSEDFPRGKVPPAVAKSQKAEKEGSKASFGSGKRDGDVTADFKKSKAKLDNLFVNTDARKSGSEKKRKRGTKLTLEEARLLNDKRSKISGQSLFQVVPMSYESLIPDMLSLGVVAEIYTNSMLIVLPGRATGIVLVTDVSDPYTGVLQNYQSTLTKEINCLPIHTLSDMFSIGLYVVVKVKSTEKMTSGLTDVKLTLNPKDVHSNYIAPMVVKDLVLVGAIKSKEDKGYQVDLGIDNVFAFMQFDQVLNKLDLRIGQLIYCKVIQAKSDKGSRRSVQVSMNIGKVQSQLQNEDSVINYNALLPGMALNTIVEKSHESGLKLSCNILEGLVHSDHMRDEWATPSSIEEASELHARVLYVHPNLTTPYLTLQTDVVPMRSITKCEDRSKLGSVQSVRVVSVTGRGVIVRLVEGNEKGFISLNNLGKGSFTSKEDISKKFKVKSEIQCKILKYAHFEQMYLCTLNYELMIEPLTDMQQATPGKHVKCTVLSVESGGLAVVIGRNVNGFIPKSFHSSQKMLEKPDEAIGKVVTGRIMYVDLDKKRVVIASKRELVKSQGAVITSLRDARVGDVGHGILNVVGKSYVVLKTIGGIKGFIPIANFKVRSTSGRRLNCTDIVKYGEIIQYRVEKVESDQLVMSPYEEDSEVQESEIILETESNKRKRTESENTTESVESCSISDVENSKRSRKKRRKNKKKRDTEVLQNQNVRENLEPAIQSSGENSDETENGESAVVKTLPIKNASEDLAEDECHDAVDVGIDLEKLSTFGKFWSDGSEDDANLSRNNLGKKPSRAIDSKIESGTEIEKVSKNKILTDTKSKIKQTEDDDSIIKKLVEDYEIQGPRINTVSSKGPTAEESWYWTILISHYKSEGQIEKARSVAKQALDFAPIAQKSQQALKVWKELFLLELAHGTEDSVKNVLKEALQRTDDKYECLKMAAITYEKEGRFEDAINIYRNQITKECSGNIDGWINFSRLYFVMGRLEDARDVFHTACNRKLDEANLTSRFAVLEIYYGDISKGTSLLDTYLQRNRHRTDIWRVYVQALMKKEQFDKARAVFQKAFEYEWKPKQVKSLLAFYKHFERDHGDEETKKSFIATAIRVLGPDGLLDKHNGNAD